VEKHREFTEFHESVFVINYWSFWLLLLQIVLNPFLSPFAPEGFGIRAIVFAFFLGASAHVFISLQLLFCNGLELLILWEFKVLAFRSSLLFTAGVARTAPSGGTASPTA
jgi:hypothetical protein